MKKHIENTRAHLGELHSLAALTEATERRILSSAEQRLDQVNAEIERAQPGIEGAPDSSQKRYLDLVQERGRLHMVIAKSRKALKQS